MAWFVPPHLARHEPPSEVCEFLAKKRRSFEGALHCGLCSEWEKDVDRCTRCGKQELICSNCFRICGTKILSQCSRCYELHCPDCRQPCRVCAQIVEARLSSRAPNGEFDAFYTTPSILAAAESSRDSLSCRPGSRMCTFRILDFRHSTTCDWYVCNDHAMECVVSGCDVVMCTPHSQPCTVCGDSTCSKHRAYVTDRVSFPDCNACWTCWEKYSRELRLATI